MSSSKTWLTTQDLADRYDIPLATVRRWRLRGGGPLGVRIGKHVRYAESDVLAWEMERRQAEKAAATGS